MYKIFLILFRESLEIFILLGIILAATRGIDRSKWFVAMGFLLGASISGVLALFTNQISNYFLDTDNEIFDLLVIGLTIIIIISAIIWMQGHGTKIRSNFTKAQEKIDSGASRWLISILTAIVVAREGVEIILFVYSVSSLQEISPMNKLFSILLGGGAGILVGAAFYFGIGWFARGYVFKVSTILLSFIAAGLGADLAGLMNFSGIVSFGAEKIWDSSSLIADNSIVGEFLNILLGYTSRPTILQVIFYAGVMLIISILGKIKKQRQQSTST